MANTSRVPAVIAALVAQLDAALDVAVFDGPALGDDARASWLEIGVDDPELGGGSGLTAASSRIEWRGLGAKSRDEHITVLCAAWAWTGEDAVSVPRASAYALVAQVEAILFADPSLGGVALFGGMSDLTLRQGLTSKGATAAVLFQVEAKARLSA